MRAQNRARPSTRICLAVLWAVVSVVSIYASGPRTKTSNNLLTVIVDGRPLSGPGTSARREAGRVLVPVSAIARALHFTIDISGRSVVVERPGVRAILDAASGRVMENGTVVLSFNGGAEIVFPGTAAELMLPSELAAALLGVSIRADDSTVNIDTGARQLASRSGSKKGGKSRRIADLYRVDFDLSSSRYASSTAQNALLSASGRLGDGRFLLTSSAATPIGFKMKPQTALFELERPNGQRFAAGDMIAASGTEFLAANIRGAMVTIPVGRFTATAFGGLPNAGESIPGSGQPIRAKYRGSVYGGMIESSNLGKRSSTVSWMAGAMGFNTRVRSGHVASGVAAFSGRRLQLRADVAVGSFKNIFSDQGQSGFALDVTGTYQLTENLAVQGRISRIARGFLGLRQATFDASDLKAAGVNWAPRRWIAISANAAVTSNPGIATRRVAFATVAASLTPTGRLPRLFISHTQNNSQAAGSSSFTLLNAAKDLGRWRTYLNASQTRSNHTSTTNLQFGANLTLNDKSSLEASQSIGSRHSLNGQFDWRMSRLFSGMLSFTAGTGYSYSPTSKMTPYGRATVSLALPRETSVQVSYLATEHNSTLMVSVRGTIFKKRHSAVLLDTDIGTANSYAGVHGRVYQDINMNGLYDPGTDKPQADVKVRIDGNRYIVSNAQGEYKLETISPGGHDVSLDLTSVRADLTLLTGGQQNVTLQPASDNSIDFRLVRTGRLHGRIWFDANENGKFDEGEKPLADVRVFTNKEHDTLSDIDGYYTLGDLAPGEVTVTLDEATLPEKMAAPAKPLVLQIYPGRETGDADMIVRNIPAEVKHFSTKTKN
jgi:hypothetical protein